MLLPLVQSYSHQCSIHFYHTPALRGLLKKILPERWNEIVGLQHMKIYIFDDSLLISGANLSHDYFTNRQDRYLIIEDCKELVDFFDQLVETVCQFSFQMNENNKLNLNPNFPHHPYESNRLEFTAEAKRRIEGLFEKQLKRATTSPFQWPNPGSHDTWIFPFVQMGQLSIYMDNLLTRQILEKVPQNAELCLATGYFNLTQDYMDSLLEASQPNIHILMAHPLVSFPFPLSLFVVNQFYSIRRMDFSALGDLLEESHRLILYLHTNFTDVCLIERRQLASGCGNTSGKIGHFTPRVCGSLLTEEIPDLASLLLDPPTLVTNSTSFQSKYLKTTDSFADVGYRSVYRDLEAQLAVVTINSSLRDQLHQERKNIFQQAELVSGTTFDHPERKIPLWVRFVIKVFRRFF